MTTIIGHTDGDCVTIVADMRLLDHAGYYDDSAQKIIACPNGGAVAVTGEYFVLSLVSMKRWRFTNRSAEEHVDDYLNVVKEFMPDTSLTKDGKYRNIMASALIAYRGRLFAVNGNLAVREIPSMSPCALGSGKENAYGAWYAQETSGSDLDTAVRLVQCVETAARRDSGTSAFWMKYEMSSSHKEPKIEFSTHSTPPMPVT